MADAVTATPVYDGHNLDSMQVKLADGSEKNLTMYDLEKEFGIGEELHNGWLEYYYAEISGDNCIMILSCTPEEGYTIIWNYIRDKIIHLANTPYAVCSAIWKDHVIDMYVVSSWRHRAELRYSVAPLELADESYEPKTKPLNLPADEVVENFEGCKITVEGDSVTFHAGDKTEVVTLDL